MTMLTPEEQATMDALQAKATGETEPAAIADAISTAVSTVATDVAMTVSSGDSRELYAAQERAANAERRVTELESQVQEANDRLAGMAETVIIADAIESVTEEEPQTVVVEAAPPQDAVTEVQDETPEAPVESEAPVVRKRSSLYGKRR